jgi:succinate dehydrogenase/fumarate reductase cytochrome b subunit
MSSLILYLVTAFLFILSCIKDKDKTKKAFLKGCNSLTNMMPQFLGIIFVVGITLALLKAETISGMLGSSSGAFGIVLSAALGSIAMMPTFVAFSTGDMLLKSGAGIAQVAALISTLTLIGIITIPMETKYIGKKATLYRNLLAFFFSIIVGFLIEGVIEIL